MVRYLPIGLLFMALTLSAQELHTFSNGEVADAEKINENFQYVLENATGSGGCSAEQDGSSVVITCADGTSGVLASEGTVVVYPEGGIVGESPVQSWPTGSIVHRDAKGQVIGPATGNRWELTLEGGWYAGVRNDTTNEMTKIVSSRAGYVYFLSEDCTGQPFIYSVGNTARAIHLTDRYYVADKSIASDQLLTKSFIWPQGFDIAGNFIDDLRCRSGIYTRSVHPAIEYQLASELQDLSFPAELVQLP